MKKFDKLFKYLSWNTDCAIFFLHILEERDFNSAYDLFNVEEIAKHEDVNVLEVVKALNSWLLKNEHKFTEMVAKDYINTENKHKIIKLTSQRTSI